VLLDTVLIDAETDAYGQPLDYNPCTGCNLCVAACPVGAISNVREFDFFACLGHNYREFPFSAPDWVDAVAAGDASAYNAKFRQGETVSMLQSLAFEPTYKSAYCMAVCPAGEDVIGPYLADKSQYREQVLMPLRQHPEPVRAPSPSARSSGRGWRSGSAPRRSSRPGWPCRGSSTSGRPAPCPRRSATGPSPSRWPSTAWAWA
jgi:ferredoxin